MISKSLKSLGRITLKIIPKTRQNRLNIGKFAIMSTKSRVANSEKWLKGKGPQKSYSSSLSVFRVRYYDTIRFNTFLQSLKLRKNAPSRQPENMLKQYF